MKHIQNLRERYESLFSNEGVKKEEINEVETNLNITLPKDFHEIAEFYSGGYLGGVSNHSFVKIDNCTNITDETIKLRESINLPLRFAVLAELDESLIVMDTKNTPTVIWCDSVEVSKLENRSFISKPNEWETYTEYLNYLVTEEEEEREE